MPTWFATPPRAIINKPANSRHRGELGVLKPQLIVLHHTGGRDSLTWLTTSPLSNVSVHRLITKLGINYKLGDDLDVMHHVGNATLCPDTLSTASNPNYRCLGIEIENLGDGKDLYTGWQYFTVAEQIVEWWGRFGYLPVVGHGAIDREKRDPVGWDWSRCFTAVVDVYKKVQTDNAGITGGT